MIETEFSNIVHAYNKERVLFDMFIEDNLDNEALNYVIKVAKAKRQNYEYLYDY